MPEITTDEATAQEADGAEAAVSEPATKICPRCKEELAAGVTFCPSCGSRVEVPAKKKRTKRETSKEIERMVGTSAVQCTNDLVGFQLLFADGMAETEDGVFCKTVKFGDIGYENERQDVQDDIFAKFCQLHLAFPPGTCYQFNLLNLPTTTRRVERLLPESGQNKKLARSYNEIIAERQRTGRTEFERVNYLTFSTSAEDDVTAARRLSSMTESVMMAFTRLDVPTSHINAIDKAALLKCLLCGPDEPLLLDFDRLANTKREHVRDFVAPAWAAYPASEKFNRKYLALPGRFVKTLLIRDFGSDLSDRALRTIRALPIPMNISLLFQPQPKGQTVKKILTNIDVIQAEMMDYSRSVARSGGDPTLMPPAMENKEASQREQLDYIQENDQTVSWFQGLITVWADSQEKLEEYVDMLMSEKGNWTIDLVELPMVQEPALTSALPLATSRLIDRFRSLSTAEGATLIPFVSQNIHDDPKRSLMAGVDRASGDAILVNPDKTKSPHMWLFGITGGGKSMQINSMLSYSLLQYPRTQVDEATSRWVSPNPKCPQWHIFDFHEEYVDLARQFDAEVNYFGPGHASCLNPMDMSDVEGELTLKDVRENTDFFLALFESMMDRRLTQREKSMVDRCLQEVYSPYIGTPGRPTLKNLFETLRVQSEVKDERTGEATAAALVAEELADSLEMYVTGSMNSFAAQTNVSTSPHMNVYVMSELGNTMQTLAMMSAIQHVRKCTFNNFSRGKPTYVIVEECQILFDNDAAVRVLEALFAEMRKYGLHIICVTQLPNRVLAHPRAVNLFENSSIFLFMPQQAENAEEMARKFRLSATQAEALSLSADVGTGLIVVDGVKVAFRNTIPHDTYCYKIWNTDPDRGKKDEKSAPKNIEVDEQTRLAKESDVINLQPTRAGIVCAIEYGMLKCKEDGVKPTRRNVRERMPLLGGERASEAKMRRWTEPRTTWCPYVLGEGHALTAVKEK